ncbi:PTS system protein [Parelusimicrobium proximum]|uniref:PTS transporter subunit EIIC n=1 Tax=Parelusimicrobium proximum TaxID=3228953 RepID=UPI003D1734F1
MSDELKETAEQILKNTGGRENIESVTSCMTRLRLHLKDNSKADKEAIKKLEQVLGVVESGGQLQIVLGPGTASKAADAFCELAGIKADDGKSAAPQTGEEKAKELKEEIKKKNNTPFKNMLKKLANIFIPLIPAFIGCGLIMAVNNILIKFVPGWAGTNYAQILAVFGGAVGFGLNIFVGVNAAKEFGGSPMIGGVMAVILTNPALANTELFGLTLVPARGGVIAVMLVVAFAAWLEQRVRKIIPDMFELFLTPFIVIFVSGVLALLVLQPLGGWISDVIVAGVNIAVSKGGALSGFLMSALFLPLVMTGLHQGLAPIHAQLIEVYGYTVLFPILAMAGAGQVGAAFYVFLKSKNVKLKKTVVSALPVGILGVGEPLIYGVTLPLWRPFIAACIGGGFGGALLAHFGVGSFTLGGISGIPLAPLVTKPLIYLAGILIAYAAGFIAAWIIGFDDPAGEY